MGRLNQQFNLEVFANNLFYHATGNIEYWEYSEEETNYSGIEHVVITLESFKVMDKEGANYIAQENEGHRHQLKFVQNCLKDYTWNGEDYLNVELSL